MFPLSTNYYASCRLQQRHSILLHETGAVVPEKFLQMVWYHQRLLRDQLKTLDGTPLRVLHPGFWNHEAGPDFRNAVLQIGNDPARSGDVEIDLRSGGWRSHGHDGNPNFANVILHVVWEPDDAAQIPAPTMALKPYLDSPINELSLWLGSDSAKSWPATLGGRCTAPLSGLSEDKLIELLRQAAHVRLQRKANELEARARQSGWEQALWEGVFRALGYKQNIWPMQRLGELLMNAKQGARHVKLSEIPVLRSTVEWQAWLFGISGLLPTQREAPASDIYLRGIWDIWWREQDAASDFLFPKTLWRFNAMRPSNLPQRRLALVSHWLARSNFFTGLEKWFTEQKEKSSPLRELQELLHVEEDDFWSWHWTFRSVRLEQPQRLIGAARISDLAINVILPWFWIRAVRGKNAELQQRAEQIYFKWPASDDNSVLRLARQRLLGNRTSRRVFTGAEQQGLHQIVKDFCEHSNAICAECHFPDLVRGWRAKTV